MFGVHDVTGRGAPAAANRSATPSSLSAKSNSPGVRSGAAGASAR